MIRGHDEFNFDAYSIPAVICLVIAAGGGLLLAATLAVDLLLG
jgi:asparagine N-glycosylation enzyme membrane subunit Stt3